ncbi:Deoxynucleoside triphosphate triphosphohydrolase SAMHD1 [Dissostichus eleginoides]|uniref:Deoxynucleoside triphosphate triphosphohydrolase SAMHD1 n=1 Tax=Dissostichus eleginoides TaxID=100907 RepID=A0AAD9FDP6_DISEL|nr:Deoxynucleoside triphosphate triphosphohydrolase SAMHD1 [Dissostichus eleginoides]
MFKQKGKTWKHEDNSVKMFKDLVDSDEDLKLMMKAFGMNLDEDLEFIKEMIKPPEAKKKYKGRPKEKSFLYEIVNNKRNGIDVDKFDYFARDSHHLGIKNNFDHGRFIKFARVCEVDEQKGDGQKHICTRDKEVNNLYDLFHTRYSLHRRAYQHNVVKIIEYMIAEAFLKADEHIQIKGSRGKMFTLSTAITDMEAYTKLTDCVFDRILNSTEDNLREAREILKKVVDRKHYKFLGGIKPKIQPKGISQLKKDLFPREGAQADGLPEQDFVVLPVTMDYGMKGKDPIDSMDFYSKKNPTKHSKSRENRCRASPVHFSERSSGFTAGRLILKV